MCVLSLFQVIGDPLEVAAFERTGFNLAGARSSVHSARKLSVDIVLCHHFSAQLRRMTTVAVVTAGSRPEYRVCVKVWKRKEEETFLLSTLNVRELLKLFESCCGAKNRLNSLIRPIDTMRRRGCA